MSMRRVSSRQRLVSWDAFDASAAYDSSEEDEDYVTCYEQSSLSRTSSFCSIAIDTMPSTAVSTPTAVTPSGTLVGRKRERSSGNLHKSVSFSDLKQPALVTCHSYEVSKKKRSMQKALNDDVQIHIVSFLTPDEARSMSVTSKYYRALVVSKKAYKIWLSWFARQWPTNVFGNVDKIVLVDHLRLPSDFQGQPNLSLLLGMAAEHQPSSVDEAALTLRSRNYAQNTTRTPSVFKTYTEKDLQLVQYTGPVGTGDRCIRADKPLAGPKRVGFWSSHNHHKHSLFNFLCRGARAVAGTVPDWRPFVAPYVTRQGEMIKVHLTPRLVSYFEVSILPCPQDFTRQRPSDPTMEQISDCIAVGVSTKKFILQSRMPGWDQLSYGYHGDDGGIFHGSGDLLRRFGPSYGQGDTVGCGVDYVNGGIFFTLNGKFLGYGWTGIGAEFLSEELYPTVGMDSNCPVSLNFGETPYQFDLTSLLKGQADLVRVSCTTTREHLR